LARRRPRAEPLLPSDAADLERVLSVPPSWLRDGWQHD